jgi:hypothetical protein
MDKILSARVDEAVLRRIGMLAQRLGTSKKAVIEAAIREYAERIEPEHGIDVLAETHGAWKRGEPPARTAQRARQAFRDSMRRHRA